MARYPPQIHLFKSPKMKRIIVRSLVVLFGLVIVVIGIGAGTVSVRWKRTFEAPFPAITASTDPAVIERGAYLAYGPAHCAYCHTAGPEQWKRLDAGERVPLSGGFKFPVPFGDFYSRNLTPDKETGIGTRTDGELARVLRHMVHADGRVVLPFMEFQDMSDEDLIAVISFLRSQPAVKNELPPGKPNTLGKALYSFALKPRGPTDEPPKLSPEGVTVERGKYLANSVAACVGCHTNRSMTDGSYIGPKFAGGMRMDYDKDPTKVFVTPNLTPDPKTGHITNWTEDEFLARFRAGEKIEGTHMPWKAYGRMGDDDVRAIYRFLRSLAPIENETGDIMQLKKPEKSTS